jgi:hypothetical protein
MYSSCSKKLTQAAMWLGERRGKCLKVTAVTHARDRDTGQGFQWRWRETNRLEICFGERADRT